MPVLDVRSPQEYEKGHIPGAINLPILNDEERKQVGTVYKQHGQKAAVLKGLELTGPHLRERVKQANKILDGNEAMLHCWRGGMRSEFYAFLLHFYGYHIATLNGGYKEFRKWVLQQFEIPLNLKVLGGYTGSGKTDVLHHLKSSGHQVIDLEALANHRGSSFGAIGMGVQPSQEQFENDLAIVMASFDPLLPVWIEDESRTIGNKVIPERLWKQMGQATTFVLDVPFEERLAHITNTYGKLPLSDLVDATVRISKRIGPQHTKKAVEYLENGQLSEGFAFSLRYYDKTYGFQLNKKDVSKLLRVDSVHSDILTITENLISLEM